MNSSSESRPVVPLSKRKARVVLEALASFQTAQLLDEPTADRMRASIRTAPFDWRRLARYSFIIAISCLIIAVIAAITDDWLLDLLSKLFQMPWGVRSAGLGTLSAALFLLGLKQRARHPEKRYSNEAIFFLGVAGIAGAIMCLGRAIDTGSGHFSLLILLAALVYGVLGVLLESKLIWGFSLLSLGGWFGAETGYNSSWGAYYLGMAYPLRFVLFGLVLTLASLLMPGQRRFADLFGVTRVWGLLYLFVALWILSIWGNHEGYEDWHHASRWELFHWSAYFAIAAGVAIYFGLRHDDRVLRGFGLTFLGINLYTRFFEFFWDGLHKAIFFAVLGVSFWIVGSRAEAIWQMRALRERVAARKPPLS